MDELDGIKAGSLNEKLTDEFEEDEFEKELFYMTNLDKRRTNLPMMIWVKTVPIDKEHDVPCVMFNNTYANRVERSEMVSISISDNPEILSKPSPKLQISAKDFEKLKQWIIKNKTVLLEYWNSNGSMCISNFLSRIKKV